MQNVSLGIGLALVIGLTTGSLAQAANGVCDGYDENALNNALADFGLTELPEPVLPPGITFVSAVKAGNLLYLSGNGPSIPNILPPQFITGRVGNDIDIDGAYQAARLTAINQLGVIKAEAGSLGCIKRFVKLFGMVNARKNFTDHPAVVNGASDLFVEVFGADCGKSARTAVGMESLPFGIPVEIDMIVELKDEGDCQDEN